MSLFRSLGKAHIDQGGHGAAVRWSPEPGYRLLTRSETLDLLGAPLSSSNSPDAHALFYEFKLVPPSVTSTPPKRARVSFGFSPGTEKLKSVQGRYGDLHLNFQFEESKAAAKP